MQRRLSVAWVVGLLVSCGGTASEPASSDAGVSPLETRRALRSEPLALAAISPRRAMLPFGVHVPASPFGPASTPVEPSIASPAAVPTRPTTFVLASPIAPMPDHSGRFVMRRRDSSTFFTSRGIALTLAGGTMEAPRGWGLHATLIGAREVQPIGERPERARVHHYVGEPSMWQTAMPTYGQLAYEEVYPGVDMVVEPSRGGFGYRFVLSPGAKLSDLVMHWEGASAVRAVEDRGVDVETGVGVLRVRGLRAYAIERGQRVELATRHVVHGSDVALEVDGWSGRVPLVIDPTIAWSSFLGGDASEAGYGVAVDGSGDVFLTGQTISTNFPTTGGFDTTYAWGNDGFVTKVSASGTLLWSSYLGGTDQDYAAAIAVDVAGDAFITGNTFSGDFPSAGGFDTTLGAQDAFVTKVTGAGTLVWSSFLGGSNVDLGYSIAVDPSGNALVSGSTVSADFPAPGGFDTTKSGAGTERDGFIAKVSGSGSLVWSSFLGGTGEEHAYAVAVDATGSAFVTGSTTSNDFPTTTGAFDTTAGGSVDAFVIKVSSSGGLLWSSYLGGAGSDSGNAIAVDASGNALVTGNTQSTNFPATGGFDTTLGLQDAFVTKMSGAGALLWSSYLGGGAAEAGRGIAVDGSGNVLFTGTTSSLDFPTAGGFDTTYGSGDMFVAKVSASGSLLWSSYLGGSSSDFPRGFAVDGSGSAFVVGNTSSADYPTTGGFDTTLSGTADVVVTKLAFTALGTACGVAAECRSSLCVDGFCCDKPCSGKCEACSATKRGAGTNGTCGPIADGTDPDSDCAARSCAAGLVTKAQLCNGAGACRSDGTIACGLYGCTGSTCATACATDADCGGSAFCAATVCTINLEVGATCDRATQCKSGFCADGVCCDKACTGACEACSATKKGKGTDGACGAVLADTDPKTACAADPGYPGSCGADGLCDGTGKCRSFAKAGTACGSTTCAAGKVAGSVCAGDSATCAVQTTDCAPYACGASACVTSCTIDGECASDAYCTSSVCAPKSALGVACKETRECASGFCADGVCCNAPCNGQCESCTETGAVGSCTPAKGAPRAGRAACKGAPCPGTCDGVNGGSCSYEAGKDCGSACGADAETVSRCDKTGACVAAAPQPCGAYVCDGSTRCKASCADNADCAPKFACVSNKCEPVGARCSDDGLSVIEITGASTPCGVSRCKGGRCVETCGTSGDCAPAYLCNAGRCEAPTSSEDTGSCAIASERPSSSPFVSVLIGLACAARLRRRQARR